MKLAHRRLALLVLLAALGGCRAQVQHGLEERDANEVVSALISRGFDARKVAEKGKKPSWAIELDEEHANDALRILTELKLPRPARTTTREVTAQVGLIETPSAERLRQMEALEGDIEQMLEGMDGVASAGVELVVPAPSRPGQAAIASKASALLRVHPASLERIQQQRDSLRTLIAASVESLKPEDVVVVIDAVTTQISAPAAAEAVPDKLRWVVVPMGILLTVLASALIFVALRLRRNTSLVKATTEPTAPVVIAPTAPRPSSSVQRPVVSSSIQRRVA
jgi:type III secretion protein J